MWHPTVSAISLAFFNESLWRSFAISEIHCGDFRVLSASWTCVIPISSSRSCSKHLPTVIVALHLAKYVLLDYFCLDPSGIKRTTFSMGTSRNKQIFSIVLRLTSPFRLMAAIVFGCRILSRMSLITMFFSSNVL